MKKWPFAEVKRLLFVGAHPDDLETIVGGTIYQMTQRGIEVVEVLCTDGNIGTQEVDKYTRRSLASARRKETRAAAKFLGVGEVVFLGHDDGELEPSLALRAELAKVYRQFQPDTLMCFDPEVRGHPDHRAAGRAATDALIPSNMPLYHPEQLRHGLKPASIKRTFVFGGRPAKRSAIYVDIGDTWDVKMESLRLHACQFGRPDFNFEWLEKWMRNQGKGIKARYAEIVRPW